MNPDNGLPRGALVTGANRGVGREIALRLAGLGFATVVNYRSKETEAESVASEIRSAGGSAFTLRADVTLEDEAFALIREADRLTGGLGVLVNNVGNYHEGPLAKLDFATWRAMMASNLDSVFLTSQAAAPLMRERGWGRIINLGFAGSDNPIARPRITPYAIAKAGVLTYSRSLARVLAGSGVTVNVVSPGVLENSVTFPPGELPMGRPGRLSELAGAVAYLVGEEAAYTSGSNIEVAGAWNT